MCHALAAILNIQRVSSLASLSRNDHFAALRAYDDSHTPCANILYTLLHDNDDKRATGMRECRVVISSAASLPPSLSLSLSLSLFLSPAVG
jgi:hypothetical protein